MKKLFAFCFLLLLPLLLPSCASDSDSLRVISDGQTHTLEGRWIYALEKNGAVKDGARYTVDEALEAVKDAEAFSLPITLNPGRRVLRQYYSIYSAAAGEVQYRGEEFSPPEAPGEYLCIAEICYGSDNAYNGYQFVFQFIK